MATESVLKSGSFASQAGKKPPANLEPGILDQHRSQRLLRRANEPQKCFVSGETESVANTSAFVSPVAFISLKTTPF
jgi:hypothetical protein